MDMLGRVNRHHWDLATDSRTDMRMEDEEEDGRPPDRDHSSSSSSNITVDTTWLLPRLRKPWQ